MEEFIQVWGGQIALGAGGVMTFWVSNRARKFMNRLTEDKFVIYTQKLIDKYISNEEGKKKLNTILSVVSNLPVIHGALTMFIKKGKATLKSQIDVLEAQILDLQNKLDMDAVKDKQQFIDMIKRLEADKNELVKEYEETT